MAIADELSFSRAKPDQLEALDQIRQSAFAPVFASFRSILGDEIYERAQARDDEGQAGLLASLMAPDSGWDVYIVQRGQRVVGFVTLQLNHDTKVGEIGLNAVHPAHAGQGVGTAMYEFAIERMRAEGMRVATVATGGDPSHAAARRAYRKAGFDVELPTVWMYQRLG